MGTVHRAYHHALDREVALKFLHPKYATDSHSVRKFVDEARIAARLQHPGIPAVHEVGSLPDGRPFLAMKLIRGRTLSALLKEQGHGSTKWLGVFEAVCQAVGAAHAAGYIHRDLKPANVMVGAFGEVQVMDWGLAKCLAASGGRQPPGADRQGGDAPPTTTDETVDVVRDAPADETEQTRAGDVKGTPLYMPPEQARGEIDRIDRRADVFALGAILCELLTGKPPLADSKGRVLPDCMAGKFAAAYARLGGCGEDAALISLAIRCLGVEPEDRPADASEVACAVAAFRADADARAKRAEVEKAEVAVQAAERVKRGRLFRWATSAVVGVLVVGTAVSVAFGVQANSKADEARAEKKKAEDAQDRERVEKENAIRARTETQRTLAQALLAPIESGRYGSPLSQYEQEALYRLAGIRGEATGEMLFLQATASPLTVRQLASRTDYLSHAIVGLDSGRRQRVNDLVCGVLDDPGTPADQKWAVALAVSRTRTFTTANRLALRELLAAGEHVVANSSSTTQEELASGFGALCQRLSKPESEDPCREAAVLLSKMLRKRLGGAFGVSSIGGLNLRAKVAEGLADVCLTLPTDEAVAILTAALANATDRVESRELGVGILRVCRRAPVGTSTETFRNAVRGLEKARGQENVDTDALDWAMRTVSLRLPADEAVRLMVDGLAVGGRGNAHWYAEGLTAATVRLANADPEPARVAVRGLQVALADTKRVGGWTELIAALVTVCHLLPPGEAAEFLLTALENTTRKWERTTLADELAEVVRHLPEELAGKVIRRVLEAFEKTAQSDIRAETARGLLAVSARTPTGVAAAVARPRARPLAAELAAENDPVRKRATATRLAVLAALLPESEANEFLRPAVRVLMAEITDPKSDYRAESLAVVVATAGRRPADEAVVDLLTATKTADDEFQRRRVVGEVVAVCRRLPSATVERTARTAVEVLTKRFGQLSGGWERRQLVEGLVSVCDLLPAVEASETLTQIALALSDKLSGAIFIRPDELSETSLILGTVCSRLSVTTAGDVVQKVANARLAELTRTNQSRSGAAAKSEVLALALRGQPTDRSEAAVLALLDALGGASPGGDALLSENEVEGLSAGVRAIVTGWTEAEGDRAALQHAAAIACGGDPRVVLLSPTLLATQVPPRLLPPRALVELLKHPFCVRDARRAVLDALEMMYHREFTDLWDFVAFAEKEHPELDLLTPPKRPEKK